MKIKKYEKSAMHLSSMGFLRSEQENRIMGEITVWFREGSINYILGGQIGKKSLIR